MDTTTTTTQKRIGRRQIALWVPDDLFDSITELAEREYLTRNAYIVQLIVGAVRADRTEAETGAVRQSA